MFQFALESRYLNMQLSQEVVINLASTENELSLNGTRLENRNE